MTVFERRLSLPPSLSWLVLPSTPVFAQGGATSPLTGVVLDTSGGALPGATSR